MHRTAAGNAPHRLARHALMSASALALTAILSAQPARAADECGAEGAGADTVTCTGAGFANGITYAGSDGLSLVLNNANMVVTKGAASDGVILSGTTANDLTVTAASLSSIDGGTGSAITVNNGGDGKAAVVLNTGTVTTNFFNQGAVQAIHNSGAGDSVITMNGGSVTNSNAVTNFDLYALVGGTGTGNATVLMTGGSLQGTATFGLRAAITNTAAAGTASITMDALGWRGYLLPRLLKKFNPLVASIVLGVTWGVWHFPLYVNSTFSTFTGAAGFTFTTICYSIIMTVLYNYSRASILIAVMCHWMINILPNAIFHMYGNLYWQMVETYMIAGYVIVTIILVLIFGKDLKRKDVPAPVVNL